MAGCAAETLGEDAPAHDTLGEDPSSAATLASPRTGQAVHAGTGVDALIGDATHSFRIVDRGSLGKGTGIVSVRDARARGLLPAATRGQKPVPATTRTTPESSLVLGYPTRLLGREVTLGGVITRVSDPDDIDLGGYKLSYLLPLHVRAALVPTEPGGDALAFLGCQYDCTNDSPDEVVFTIPVLGLSPDGRQIYLDIGTLGQGLSIEDALEYPVFGYTEIESRATFADHSENTLVFDVQSILAPSPELAARAASDDQPDRPLRMTVRWYIKLGAFTPDFTARDPIPEFGYFTTARSARPRIMRFATGPHLNRPPVKYYIKNVPPGYRDAFSAAFDDWNRIFRDLLGYDLFAYEHLAASDPRSATIVNGDVRYNVVEWDLDNRADYGGLGPMVSHQRTGQTFSGMVLIQGPWILQLYQDWFAASARAAELRAAGDAAAAEKLLAEHQRRLQAVRRPAQRRTRMRLGQLSFEIPAEQPELMDPLPIEFVVDTPPPVETFDSFMRGYFRGTVAHEIGHNLGLHHNFGGSVSANGVEVSHSVMEYVVRAHRHLVRVAGYDRQAMAYGYLGDIAPDPLLYCERLPHAFEPHLSAECSVHDGGPDPFGFFREQRVRRVIGLLIGRGLGAAPPAWGIFDVYSPYRAGVQGMAFYATSAESTADTWVTFHRVPGRPTEPDAIREYVLAEIHGAICEPSIVAEIQAKFALDRRAGYQAKQNWLAALEEARSLLAQLDLSLAPCALVDELPF